MKFTNLFKINDKKKSQVDHLRFRAILFLKG